MILTADIGNSTTTLALFNGEGRLVFRSSFSTDPHATQDQFAIQLFSVFQLYQVDLRQVTGGIIASVVPPVTEALSAAVTRLMGKPPLVVGTGIRTGLNIRADLHTQLGADIVAYCVGAVAKYPSPVIVVDLGTAITFSVLRGNVYAGCVIAPGVRVGLEALSKQAAELPHISLAKPGNILGRNTVDAMRAGAVYGNACLVDGMIARLEEATEPAVAIVATGSYVDDVVPYCRRSIIRDPDLLLEGLYLLYQKNTEGKK
ncbi:MAG: type III pantothenate kinase [Clostridiales bacterium]|nr:type III pantothenate kinase [Clostridiales bacterium]